jgi:hypothetical protein
MNRRKYTPLEVRTALDCCSPQGPELGDDPLCDECPFSKGAVVCDDVIVWDSLPPHFRHPSDFKRKERHALHKAACEKLCDPLYMDLLKVKGGRKCRK